MASAMAAGSVGHTRVTAGATRRETGRIGR